MRANTKRYTTVMKRSLGILLGSICYLSPWYCSEIESLVDNVSTYPHLESRLIQCPLAIHVLRSQGLETLWRRSINICTSLLAIAILTDKEI